jgi:hypothetical protein
MRRSASGEARHGKIETAPEEVNGTDFAEEPRPEPVEDAVDRHERLEEARHGRGVVRPLLPIMPKRYRMGDLVGPTVEFRYTAETSNQFAELAVKLGNAHRPERDFPLRPSAASPITA